MQWLLVAAVMAAGSPAIETCSCSESAAATIRDDVQTGTLIFSRGDCLAIKAFTASGYTHVAAVVVEEDGPMVFDSMNGCGVRRQSLDRYLASQQPNNFRLYHPQEPMSEECAALFIDHLKSELGRPYSVAHHVTGKRVEGVHCAEYVTEALIDCGLLRANRPSRVSPASLVEGIVESDLYVQGEGIELTSPAIARQKGSNWCAQLWFDTAYCTRNCWGQMARWFCCK